MPLLKTVTESRPVFSKFLQTWNYASVTVPSKVSGYLSADIANVCAVIEVNMVKNWSRV